MPTSKSNFTEHNILQSECTQVIRKMSTINSDFSTVTLIHLRGCTFGWGTAVQAGKSRFL